MKFSAKTEMNNFLSLDLIRQSIIEGAKKLLASFDLMEEQKKEGKDKEDFKRKKNKRKKERTKLKGNF